MQRRYEFVLTSTVVQSNIGSTCLYRDVDVSAGQLACHRKNQEMLS